MEDERKTKVRDIIESFHFRQICGDDASLDREIVIADTNRPGLELAGFFDFSQVRAA